MFRECGQQRSKVKMLLLHHCALRKLHVKDGQNRRDQIARGRRLRPLWSNCVLCIPFILSGIPNECWLPTCNVFVTMTWRLGLWATRGARNKWSVISERVVAIFWPFGHWVVKSFPFIVTSIKHSGGSRGGACGGLGTPYLKTKLRPEGPKNCFFFTLLSLFRIFAYTCTGIKFIFV